MPEPRETAPMRPEDVPAEWIEVYAAGAVRSPDGHAAGYISHGLAAVEALSHIARLARGEQP